MVSLSVLACAGLVTLVPSPARASLDQYSVEAGGEVVVDLVVCSAESQLAVRGDTGTDLDFVVTDPAGRMIYSDQGIDDYLSILLEKDGEGCASFGLAVSNLGEEDNAFTVVLEPVVESSTRVTKSIIGAGTTETIGFKACGTGAMVSARGDGDTDLDFVIRNSDGAVVHEDDDETDETSVELTGLLSDCEVFEIEVANLGQVYNAMMLVVEPKGADNAAFAGTAPSTALASTGVASVSDAAGTARVITAEASGAGEYRAGANTRVLIDLPVCGATRLEVRGTGETDLDFTVSDAMGETIHSDADLSDVTFAALDPGGACETFTLAVENLGAVENVFDVALIDPATRTGTLGEGEYRINANSSTKVALRVCDLTKVSARGQGETDLDFDVTDANGQSVHTDYDLTDATEFLLDPGSGCEDYQMQVGNLGDTTTTMTVALAREGGAVAAGKGGGATALAIAGSRKGSAADPGAGRKVSLLNNTGEALKSLYWSNSATLGWGEDKLAGASLAREQQWNVDVTDGSNACLFDFRAVTESAREIEIGAVNVCEAGAVAFE
jgi:hypothetical protein